MIQRSIILYLLYFTVCGENKNHWSGETCVGKNSDEANEVVTGNWTWKGTWRKQDQKSNKKTRKQTHSENKNKNKNDRTTQASP